MACSRIRLANGARQAETLLLGEVSRWVQEASRNPGLLSSPLRILVPSRSLREHLGALLVRKIRPGLAGIRIQTLRALAVEILESANRRIPAGALLVELLIRKHGSEERVLREELGHLRDGMGVVVGSVVDFLEAGLEEAHLEALQELICSKPGLPGAKRVEAILRVACATLRDMRELGVGLNSTPLVLAREELESGAWDGLVQGPILIHGFADATGVGLDFLEALFRLRPCQLILDHPPYPGRWDQRDPGQVFTSRLLERLSRHASWGEEPRGAFPPPHLLLFHAPGARAECRQVALMIQGLLREGARPESIGVVARRLEPYTRAIRSQFSELGIPFSGVSAKGPRDPAYRSLVALGELLRSQERCKLELWLELAEHETKEASRQELLMALRCLGAARLRDALGLELERISRRWPGGYPLPLRHGLEEEGEDSAAPRKKIPVEELQTLRNRAIGLLETLGCWEEFQGSFQEHSQKILGLVSGSLGWRESSPGMCLLKELLEDSGKEIPPRVLLSGEEFLLILQEQLQATGSPRLGGKGGGIQVLEVMEARARTFEQLFLMGMNREVFPRPVQEDPLVPDSWRRILLPLLPDLPLKEWGFEEERYLFAQLLSSSPRVTLSWQSVDEDGNKKGASPLVEQLRLAIGLEPLAVGLPLWQECVQPSSPPGLLPPKEHALRAGLQGRRDALKPLFHLALKDSCPKALIHDPEEVARARLLVLEEMDPDLATPQGRARSTLPGPYLGLVGPAQEPADPRRGDLHVTTLESLATCPWQSLLKKLLRLEPPRDPLENLPELTRAQLGKLVHRVMESLMAPATQTSGRTELLQSLKGKAGSVPWPIETGKLQRLALQLAEEILEEEGMNLGGLSRALATQALPYLQVAREIDWPQEDSRVSVLAVEAHGSILLGEGQHRALFFRVDRADLTPRGLLLTDYKVGRSISEAAKEETRRHHFLQQVARGQKLQAAAYASLDAKGLKTVGRYLFLEPGLPHGARVYCVSGQDEDFLAKFKEVASLLMEAWDSGVFFPRLVGPDGRKEPNQCGYCELSLACVRGDSGARARLLRWAQGVKEKATPETLESLFLELWDLPAREGRQPLEGN